MLKIQSRSFQEIEDFGLGRLPTRAITLQEVEILPTLVLVPIFGLIFGLKMVEGFKGLFGQKNDQNPTFFGDGGLCLGELEVNFHIVFCFTKAN